MLIIGGSGSGKTNALINLIKEQGTDNLIDNIYLDDKDLNEPKNHQWLKSIYRSFKYYELYVQQYWWLQPNKEKKNFDCVWQHLLLHYKNKINWWT